MSKLLYSVLCVSVIFLGSSDQAFAKKRKRAKDSARVSPINYGMAGCGVGTLVFDQDNTGSQLGVTSVQYLVPAVAAMGGLYTSASGAASGNSAMMNLGTLLYYGGSIAELGFMPSWAMSSGTSNCLPQDGLAQSRMEQDLFIAANLGSIKKDASKGHGSYLSDLSGLLGCNSEFAQLRLASNTQEQYNKIFETDEPEAVTERFRGVITADSYLREQCLKVY
jgi:hypothetical protein